MRSIGLCSDTPLVAIATPVYNGAEYLAEAMEAVQSQTYPHLVHCVLDNASTDQTPNIIKQYQQRRVRLISARNSGTLPVVDNWNAVLELIPPDACYFRILAADDLIDATYVARMVSAGQQNLQAAAIACEEKRGESIVGADIYPNQVSLDGRDIVRRTLCRKLIFPYDHCLYRVPSGGLSTSFFEAQYNGTALICADVDAAMRVISQGRCAFVHETLATTRWPGAVTSTQLLPNQVGIWSTLQLIDRWKSVFDTDAEYQECRRAHLHRYYLHLLWWRAQGKAGLARLHTNWLDHATASPSVADYACSLLELPRVIADKLASKWAHSLAAH
jgi:glycosyltransferase involved in cell wall biosynthesis